MKSIKKLILMLFVALSASIFAGFLPQAPVLAASGEAVYTIAEADADEASSEAETPKKDNIYTALTEAPEEGFNAFGGFVFIIVIICVVAFFFVIFKGFKMR